MAIECIPNAGADDLYKIKSKFLCKFAFVYSGLPIFGYLTCPLMAANREIQSSPTK